MRELFIVDTPYQIFNCMNLIYNRKLKGDVSTSDIFIVDQFNDASNISKRIQSIHLFNTVYCLKPLERYDGKQVIIQWMVMLIRLLFPNHVLKEQIEHIAPKEFKNKYDVIYASYFNPTVASLLNFNRNATYNHMEDGTGSYFADLLLDATGWKYRLISKITRSGSSLASVRSYYLNRPELYNGKKTADLIKLPDINEDFIDIGKKVFISSIDKNIGKMIWLSDPMQDNEYGSDTYNKVKNLVSRFEIYKNQLSVRIHPREKNTKAYKQLHIDRSTGIWEIIISQIDIESKILIALFSTAQFTPKILYNKEPTLIFLNEIYGVRYVEERKKMIDGLRCVYLKPERVIAPNTEEELFSVLRKLI